MNGTNKIAILIDGDNAESALIEQILAEAGKFGRVTIKRIYSDWTETRMTKWKDQLNKHALRPMQKFAYAYGKNSTDTALIIDAMDILHTNLVDGFCIVSSDSDYTGLAHRIREQGFYVMGIGRSHTPEAFVKACENFTFTEILLPQGNKDTTTVTKSKDEVFKAETPKLIGTKVVGKIALPLSGSLKKTAKFINLKDIERAFNMVVDVNTGLAFLSRFSQALRQVDPTFDHRNYGCSSFGNFCKKLEPNYSMHLHEDGQTISLIKNE